MAVGDVHIAGPNGWPLCDSNSPLRGYSATSPACRDCEEIEWQQRQSTAQAAIAIQPRTFRVINGENGYGLSRDCDIISYAFFSAGWRHVDQPPAAVNIHLERVEPRMLSSAKHNVVVPNPEWWCPVGNVGVTDLNNAIRDASVRVWAKTRDAERIFRSLGAHVDYLGFRSHDRSDPTIAREPSFLHVAGIGPNKKTERLISLWRPEWPSLTITCGKSFASPHANVHIIVDRLTDGALRVLQNRHRFHIYPSRYEGFGHAQWEALSCGAIVFVTDGPPFEEQSAFRLLASTVNGGPEWNQLVSWRDVKEDALAEAIDLAQKLSADAIQAQAEQSRSAWQQAAKDFSDRVSAAIHLFGEE